MKHLFFIAFCLITATTYSQDNPQSLFWNNYSLTNPAATGLFNKHYASVTGRNQWSKLNYSRKNLNAIYDYQLSKHHSLGANFMYYQVDYFKENKVSINYAYQFPLTIKGNLSIGSSINFKNIEKEYLWITPDGTPPINDPLIPTHSSKNYIDFNFGAMFKTDKMLLGIGYIDGINKSNSRKIFSTISYDVNITKNISLTPRFQSRYEFYYTGYNQMSVDINLTSTFNKMFNVGFSYRTNDWFGINAGINFKEKFTVCYAFDYSGKVLNLSFGNTHELGLVMKLN